MTEQLTTLSMTHGKPPAAHAYMWIKNRNASAGYSVDMTPLTDPVGTYYAAIQWDGGYTGLQSGGDRFDRQLQFSVWNAPGYGDAELIDNASDVLCTPFGGEGTGINCEMHYPWAVGSTYRFEVTEEEMKGGSAITLHVTDLASGHRRLVGTIRFARRGELHFLWDVRRRLHGQGAALSRPAGPQRGDPPPESLDRRRVDGAPRDVAGVPGHKTRRPVEPRNAGLCQLRRAPT